MMINRLLAAALVAASPGIASASAIIQDGNVVLGVDNFGQLNIDGGVPDVDGTSQVGVRWVAPGGTQFEATSHGCDCEGWGLAVGGTSGWANNDDDFDDGARDLTLVDFSSTSSTARSVVTVDGTTAKVTHDFRLSKSDNLYEVVVTVENTGASALTDLVYRRVFDWDTSPTPFDEYVTIRGTATTTLLKNSSNDGFESSDPFETLANIGPLFGTPTKVDFTAAGPDDHGAAFDFALANIAAGASTSFSIFYGGAPNLAAAEAALGTVGAELFSLGWSGLDANQDGFGDVRRELTPTFIFAFKGVGGSIIIPDPDPEPEVPGVIPLPAGAWLMLSGLVALGAVRRKSRKAA